MIVKYIVIKSNLRTGETRELMPAYYDIGGAELVRNACDKGKDSDDLEYKVWELHEWKKNKSYFEQREEEEKRKRGEVCR